MITARSILESEPMRPLQYAAVAITVGLNALDGFDVLSISFASPGIAQEWHINRAALGAVLSMELIGMALGSIFLGGVADRIGRRPTMLGCLLVMAAAMFGATTAHDVTTLSLWRVLTGLGIGGMLATINAVAAEFANARAKTIALAIMVIGYPLGAVIGGLVAAQLLQGGDWRQVFVFGASATACFVPLVALFVPESPAWLAGLRTPNALARVNAVLARLGHRTLAALPARVDGAPRASVMDILRPGLIATTLIVTFAYFAHVVTFYFLLKWTPKIVADMGYAASRAAGVLVWANVGGASGGAIFGLLAQRVALKPLTLGTLALSAAMVALFGQGARDLAGLSMLAGAAGFFTNAAIVGLYSIFARTFPTHVRAAGTGFAIGVGRGGAALSPWIAGLLFEGGFALPQVAGAMACGSVLAFGALLFLRFRDADGVGLNPTVVQTD